IFPTHLETHPSRHQVFADFFLRIAYRIPVFNCPGGWIANEFLPNRVHRDRADWRRRDVREQDETKFLIRHESDLRVEPVDVASMFDNFVTGLRTQEPAETVVN